MNERIRTHFNVLVGGVITVFEPQCHYNIPVGTLLEGLLNTQMVQKN